MGMFDYVKCEYPMPEGFEDVQDAAHQTKDLECYMTNYLITREGRLVEHRRFYEDHPTETRRDAILKRDVPVRVRNGESFTDLDFHGDLDFGTFNTETSESVDLLARFTEGCLQWIKGTREVLR